MIVNWIVGLAATLGAFLFVLMLADVVGPPADGAVVTDGVLALIAGSAIWASIDTRRLNFSRFEMSFPGHPTAALLLVGLLWIVGFPWFVATRLGIARGMFRGRVSAESTTDAMQPEQVAAGHRVEEIDLSPEYRDIIRDLLSRWSALKAETRMALGMQLLSKLGMSAQHSEDAVLTTLRELLGSEVPPNR